MFENSRSNLYVGGSGRGLVTLADELPRVFHKTICIMYACRHLVNRLLLVNPSTSYLKSPISRVAPLMAELPRELYAAAPLALAPALIANTDPQKLLEEFIFRRRHQISDINSASSRSKPIKSAAWLEGLFNPEAAGTFAGILEQLRSISRNLPTPQTLSQRLGILERGVSVVEQRLGDVEQRTMILVGGRDRVLPSHEEGDRLAKKMQRAFVKVRTKQQSSCIAVAKGLRH
jgi:pimeloyl-ACP methyl ester carboxylesterase